MKLDTFDHRISLRVERDGAYGLPVARMETPARRMSLAGAFVDLLSGSQDLMIMSFVLCRWAHVADAAVQVSVVVPVHELHRRVARGLQVGKAPHRKLGPVLGGAEQRLDEGVVIGHTRMRLRRLDAKPLQHRQRRRRGLERGAVVAPRQNTCGAHRMKPGPMMEEQVGAIRTSIQGQGRGAVAAA